MLSVIIYNVPLSVVETNVFVASVVAPRQELANGGKVNDCDDSKMTYFAAFLKWIIQMSNQKLRFGNPASLKIH